ATGKEASARAGELDLALRLIDELSSTEFKPGQYHDDYREKLLHVIESKVEGKEITAAAPLAQRTQVIDLMAALKQSLETRVSKNGGTKSETKKPAAKSSKTTTAKENKRASR